MSELLVGALLLFYFPSGLSFLSIRPATVAWSGTINKSGFFRTTRTTVIPCAADSVPFVGQEEIWKLPRLYVGAYPSITPLCIDGRPLSGSLQELGRSNVHPLFASKLGENILLTLSADQTHYLSNVLRLNKARAPAKIRVFDGVEEWLAEILIESGSGRSTRSSRPLMARCLERLRSRQDGSSCWLFVALPKKKDRGRWLVEKCTELAVAGMAFLETDFSETPGRYDKFSSYAVEASEQCERVDLPHLFKLTSTDNKGSDGDELYASKLSTVLNMWAADPDPIPILLCRERTDKALSVVEAMQSKIKDKFNQVACFIGPEGGWSDVEKAQFDAMEAQFPASFYNVALGSSILRTETAAVVVAAAHSMICRQ